MATEDTQRRGEARPVATFDVTMRLALATDVGQEELEELSVRMQEAVEHGTGAKVLGVSVTGEYSPPVIDVGVDVLAATNAELHQCLAEILALIERDCSVEFVTGDTHFERTDDPDRALAMA